ncbi:MAG: hypothetical protein RL308_2443 [Bacteroidota bacterium]|jgi:hypothetical protein
MLGISTTNVRVGGFRGKGVDANAQAIYNRIIADGGVSNLTRLNFFVKGLKGIYGSLANVPVCYDAHWIGYKLGSGTGATAGQAAAKLYSLTVAGDAVQSTAASQPLLLAHNGASSDNYYQGVGVTSNFVSTPSATANSGTGDKEFNITVNALNWSNDYNQIVAKNTGGLNGYYVATRSSARIGYGCSRGDVVSTVGHSFANNTLGYIRVTHDTVNGIVKFFTSTDGITYTQLGSNVSITSGSTTDTSTPLCIGANNNGTSNSFTGKVYRATISNSIGGTPVVDFNPATYNASTSQTAWTSATGEVWTINTSTATTGYKGVLVDRTIVQADGVDDFIQNATVSRGDIMTQYLAYKTENASASGIPFIDSATINYQNAITPVSTIIRLYMGASNVQKTLATTLTLYTTTNNQGILNTIQRNNDIEASNSFTPAPSGLGVTIGKSAATPNYQKGNLNTYLCITGVDNTTVRTATYNLIRSLNNNAF